MQCSRIFNIGQQTLESYSCDSYIIRLNLSIAIYNSRTQLVYPISTYFLFVYKIRLRLKFQRPANIVSAYFYELARIDLMLALTDESSLLKD